MSTVILGTGFVCAYVLLVKLSLVVNLTPKVDGAREARRLAVQHMFRRVIRENLYCARCGARVTAKSCTGWDEDGNVYDGCGGKLPLIDDITWKPTLQKAAGLRGEGA